MQLLHTNNKYIIIYIINLYKRTCERIHFLVNFFLILNQFYIFMLFQKTR